MMKAAAIHQYGPPEVVRVDEFERPTPTAEEIRIRVHATTVSAADSRLRAMRMPLGFALLARLAFGVFRPRKPILGLEFAGVVDAIGPNVDKFEVGDRVFGLCSTMGCHAEFVCVTQHAAVALIPANLTFEEAVALPFGGSTALHFFRKAELRAGESVLVNGASGAVGVAMVQIARHAGAVVTAVCSDANASTMRSLGAAEVIDYNRDDFAAQPCRYDVIVDTVGNAPYSRCRKVLKERGRLLAVSANLPQILFSPLWAMLSGRRVFGGPAGEHAEDMRVLAARAAAGDLKAVVDSRFPFQGIVNAHRRVDSGRKVGSVVLILR
ncbi:MAG: NAD(P)-dependent alcohol dehydrogenase [Xanthomonadaceae bacterium]|nr:NAD(P)-dependent alcohol dehydrogenase [Xanthomonadaceae bacterium]